MRRFAKKTVRLLHGINVDRPGVGDVAEVLASGIQVVAYASEHRDGGLGHRRLRGKSAEANPETSHQGGDGAYTSALDAFPEGSSELSVVFFFF